MFEQVSKPHIYPERLNLSKKDLLHKIYCRSLGHYQVTNPASPGSSFWIMLRFDGLISKDSFSMLA